MFHMVPMLLTIPCILLAVLRQVQETWNKVKDGIRHLYMREYRSVFIPKGDMQRINAEVNTFDMPLSL